MKKMAELSMTEAENILQEQMPLKEFWNADVIENIDLLQNVLNSLFNTKGNAYEAAYIQAQSGPRLIIKCNVCNKDLTSLDLFLSHNNGKIHKKNVNQSTEESLVHSELIFKEQYDVRGYFPKGSVEERLDQTSEFVLGVAFVFREYVDGVEYFTCQLCRKERYSARDIFDHIVGNNHVAEYMKVKHGIILSREKDPEKILSRYEKYEGRIHHSIFTVGGIKEEPNICSLSSSSSIMKIENLCDKKLNMAVDTEGTLGVVCENPDDLLQKSIQFLDATRQQVSKHKKDVALALELKQPMPSGPKPLIFSGQEYEETLKNASGVLASKILAYGNSISNQEFKCLSDYQNELEKVDIWNRKDNRPSSRRLDKIISKEL